MKEYIRKYFILRKRACFIRADYLRASQRFHGGQLADYRVFL